MKFIDLFAGIGGFALALERLGHECVYTNEYDKYAATTYKARLGHDVDTRDITTVPTSEIPDHDLLCGGFPCQAFSIAGKRRGFDDTRGTMFFEIARILRDKRPRYLLLENVKGLLSHDSGRTFKIIISTLDELGYDCQWQVLNSKNFGVPQNRERVFIIGHLRGEPRPQVFPITDTSRQAGFIGDAIAWSKSHRTGTAPEDYKRKNRGKTEYRIKPGEFNTLNTGDGCGSQSTQNYIAGRIDRNQFKPTTDESLCITANYWKGPDNHGQRTVIGDNNMKIRRLTPLECERLQGFPDNWTEGVSDTQRYKQCGNAVTVNVVYEIAKRAWGQAK